MPHEEKKKTGKGKRKAVTSAVAAVTAAGVMVGSAFDTAGSLLQEKEDAALPAAYVDTLLPDDGGDDDGQDDQDTEKSRKRGLKTTVREYVLRLPVAVRLVVILPLWLIGQFVIGWAAVLWPAASPLVARIAAFALLLLVVLGAFALTAKAAFPDLPLKKVLNRKSFLILGIGAAILGAADLILGATGVELRVIRLVEAGGSLLMLICAAIPAVVRGRREEAREQEASLPAQASPRKLTFVDGGGEFTIRTDI